jgi:hypothetical protein
MSEPVGWLRAVVVDAADPPRLSEVWQGVLGVGVVEAESDRARGADGPKGTPG